MSDQKPQRLHVLGFQELIKALECIRDQSRNIDLPGAVSAAGEALEALSAHGRISGDAVSFDQAGVIFTHGALSIVVTTFKHDAKGRFLLRLPSDKVPLYEQAVPPFGAEVASKFSTRAVWEIEEAGKCLALGRDTACAFHLMRTLEVALEALRLCLGLSPAAKSQEKAWGEVLRRYQIEIDARNNPQHPRQWKSDEDKEFFRDLKASLDAVKDAWRNKTMHVEKRYTPDEAAHIYAVVKGFMQKVASRLDEDGLPQAH